MRWGCDSRQPRVCCPVFREGEMGGGGQAMKRIPLIKFPQRHPKPTPASGSSQNQAAAKEWDARRTMSDVPAAPINTAVGGKASLQPKRTPVSDREMDAILLGGCL